MVLKAFGIFAKDPYDVVPSCGYKGISGADMQGEHELVCIPARLDLEIARRCNLPGAR